MRSKEDRWTIESPYLTLATKLTIASFSAAERRLRRRAGPATLARVAASRNLVEGDDMPLFGVRVKPVSHPALYGHTYDGMVSLQMGPDKAVPWQI